MRSASPTVDTESTHLGLAPIEDDGVEQEPGAWPIGAITTEIERSGWRGVVLVRVRYVREAGMGDKVRVGPAVEAWAA